MNIEDIKRTLKNLRAEDPDTGTFLANVTQLLIVIVFAIALIVFWIRKWLFE